MSVISYMKGAKNNSVDDTHGYKLGSACEKTKLTHGYNLGSACEKTRQTPSLFTNCRAMRIASLTQRVCGPVSGILHTA